MILAIILTYSQFPECIEKMFEKDKLSHLFQTLLGTSVSLFIWRHLQMPITKKDLNVYLQSALGQHPLDRIRPPLAKNQS